MTSASLYLRYIAVSFRSQLQYRASFVVKTLAHMIGTGLEFLGLWALFDRFGRLGDWTLAEVAMFYGIVHVAFAIPDAACRGFDMLAGAIKGGEFDRILLRPRSPAMQLVAQELTLRRAGRLVQGMAVLIWAAGALSIHWTIAKVVLLVASILGGACLFSGIVILQATAAFWTIESLEIFNTITYGGVETAQYPLSIYRGWFRRLFTYVIPLACINYFPAMAILDRPDALGLPVSAGYFAPAVGFAFLLLSLQVFRLGVRRYTSTGS